MATYKIKGTRYLRKYTSLVAEPTYAAAIQAQNAADALCDVPWERSDYAGPAEFTSHDNATLDGNVANRERFDAALFCAGHEGGRHMAYANAAFYLFKLPAAAEGVSLESVTVKAASDPYNSSGLRIAVHVLSSAELPTACATVRSGAGYVEGAVPRTDNGKTGDELRWFAAQGDVTVEPDAATNLTQYLAVFVGLENYATSRDNWLEGSGVVNPVVTLTTGADVSGLDADEVNDCSVPETGGAAAVTLLAGGASPTWLEPPVMVNAGVSAAALPEDSPLVETFFTTKITKPGAVTPHENSIVIPCDIVTTSDAYGARLSGVLEVALSGTTLASATFSYQVSDRCVKVTSTSNGLTTTSYSFPGRISSNTSGRVIAAVSGGAISPITISGTMDHEKYVNYTFQWVTDTDWRWDIFPTVSVSDSGTPGQVLVSVGFSAGYCYGQHGMNSGTYGPAGSLSTYYAYTGAAADYITWLDENNTEVPYSMTPPSTTQTLTAYSVAADDAYYLMLKTASHAPVDADLCDSPSEAARRHEACSIAVVTAGEMWTVTVDGTAYAVEYDSTANKFTLFEGSTVLGQWTSSISVALTTFFDAAALVPQLADVKKFGLAAACGDFSAAVATFEAGTQPSDAEVLGRLARLARETSGAMASLHPMTAALAEELDVMRPVPRFWRAAAAPSPESPLTAWPCQPGLSAWYFRSPSAGSDASWGADSSGGAVELKSVVARPAFLQLAFLALRSPAALKSALVLKNVGAGAVPNAFRLRFVAWRSDAAQWDRSNSFALAVLASMPSVYRSDGPEEVSWTADLSGTMFPFGERTVRAKRVGVSGVVDGQIAANAEVEIPLDGEVGEADVVLVAPEVIGFVSGGAAHNAYFGRQADPAGSGGEDDAEAHNYAWARYEENLGWFPEVKGS